MSKIILCIVLLFCFSISILPVIAQTPTIVAKFGSTPTMDGFVGENEWSDASSITFNETQVFLKQDGKNLYIAFKAPTFPLSAMIVYIDVNNDRGLLLQTDDIALGIANSKTLMEGHAVNSEWTAASITGWTGYTQTASNTAQFEFSITYAKLNIVAGSDKTFGINFAYQTSSNTQTAVTVFYWLNTADLAHPENNPSAWGIMNSSGYKWVPEFSSLLALSLLMMAMLFLTFAYRRSHNKQSPLTQWQNKKLLESQGVMLCPLG